MNRYLSCVAFLFGGVLFAVPARAVVVAGDFGTTDEAAPTLYSDNGNNIGGNVGTFNGASGIYIGNGWVLTADHVGAGNPTFPGANGGSYNYDGTSGVQLKTPDGTGLADLYLFHLTINPTLPNMALSSTGGATLASNLSSVVMYGHSQSIISGPSYYDTTKNPYAATTTATNERGYATTFNTGSEVFRAGRNFVAASQANVDDGYGKTNSLLTFFNPLYTNNATDKTPAESQASLGDSGGAMFGRTATGGYQLVGMIFAIGNTLNDGANQPSVDTAAYSLTSFAGDGTTNGDTLTAAADISSYLPQIESITGVPEPSTGWVIVLLAGAGLGFCRGRVSRPVA